MGTFGTYLQLAIATVEGGTTENAFAVGTNTVLCRVRATGTTCTINGIAGGEDGRVLIVSAEPTSSGTGVLAIANESASASAANRITMAGASVAVVGGSSVLLIYDGASSRWRLSNT